MTTPTIVSIQVGLPAEHGADSIADKAWQSGIFKSPISGRLWLDRLNLEGDQQHDLHNHGGEYRAVLAYSAEHYPIWRAELFKRDLPYGAFGENFTLAGLTEETVCLGDTYAVGDQIVLQVSQLRLPCWKLARRCGVRDLALRVEAKGWGGWYHRVVQPGYVQAGDTYRRLERPYPQHTIARMNALIFRHVYDREALAELASIDVLTPSYRAVFARLAAEPQAPPE